jgi:hypothetical protein
VSDLAALQHRGPCIRPLYSSCMERPPLDRSPAPGEYEIQIPGRYRNVSLCFKLLEHVRVLEARVLKRVRGLAGGWKRGRVLVRGSRRAGVLQARLEAHARAGVLKRVRGPVRRSIGHLRLALSSVENVSGSLPVFSCV